MTRRVGNAPVSFGAWNLEASRHPSVPPAERVLAEVAAAGYDGIELGPLGYIDPAQIAEHGLELAGAYVSIPFGDGVGRLEETLDVFDAFAPQARPILADKGGAGALQLDDVARVVERVRARGYEPTFHHHLGTRVETRAEIERLLDGTDVHLLLDTGHAFAAGFEPVEALGDWRERIDYVHLKDVTGGAFCELGTGEVDVRGFLAQLEGYDGWLVVEQDWLPQPGEDPEEQIAAQHRNRRFLG